MTRMRLLALALSLAVAPALAADTAKKVDEAAVKQKVESAQAAANAGDMPTALRLLGEATVMADSGPMAHKLGHLYEQASVPDHEAYALKWYLYAVDRDDAESMHHVGLRYIEGKDGLPRDEKKGLALMNASAKGDYGPAASYMQTWNAEQDTKARCMLSELRGYRMAQVVFGGDRFYDFSDTGYDTGGGDTYDIIGLRDYNEYFPTDPEPVALEVDGFSHVGYTESNGSHFYHDYYDKRRPSSAALQRAAQVRAKCGVVER